MMWIFVSGGFLSVVSHRHKQGHLLVRTRNMVHLQTAFPNAEHFTLDDADYPHRAEITRENFALFLTDYVMNMEYDNFKKSIREFRYSSICHNVWSLMYRYGIPHRGVE